MRVAARRLSAAMVLACILAATPVAAQETGVVSGTVTLRENGGLVDGVYRTRFLGHTFALRGMA